MDLSRYDHVLLDLDGCVWVGDTPTPRAVEAVAALRTRGKGLAFVTNDTMRSPEEYVRKLWRLGFQASVEEVVTVGGAVQHVLAENPRFRTAYVIGGAAIHQHVLDANIRIVRPGGVPWPPDVVVLAGHPDLSYRELKGAVQAGIAGAPLLAAGRDPVFPMPDGPWPGTGALVAAVEYATGLEAQNVGKPDAQIFRTALDRLPPGRALVIGDRLESDVAGAIACGLDAALVGGEATADDGVVACAPTLADLVLKR